MELLSSIFPDYKIPHLPKVSSPNILQPAFKKVFPMTTKNNASIAPNISNIAINIINFIHFHKWKSLNRKILKYQMTAIDAISIKESKVRIKNVIQPDLMN